VITARQTLLSGSLALVLAAPAAAGDVSVTDGDGLRIGDERIRLWGIDAVELHRECKRNGAAYACGIEARNALQSLLRIGELSCEKVDRDRYGRTVARCTVDGKDLGAAMVRSGWAVDFQTLQRRGLCTRRA
jgi:endonuclease YncB( thermonuclease family)